MEGGGVGLAAVLLVSNRAVSLRHWGHLHTTGLKSAGNLAGAFPTPDGDCFLT